MQIISRTDARNFGLARYFSGNACPFGHVAERHTSNAHCCQCNIEECAASRSRARVKAEQLRAERREKEKPEREERERLRHERKLANIARAEADAAVRALRVKTKADEREARIAAGIQVRAERQALTMRSHRRRGKAKAAGYAPPPLEDDCPSRPVDGRCQSCGRTPRHARFGETLCLDHDHRTGKFRGWICDQCNRGIGLLGDLPGGVMGAHEYLMRHYKDEPDPLEEPLP